MIRHAECLSVVRQLWPCLDGVLPESLQQRATEHFARCAMCQSHFDFARFLLAAVHEHGGVNGHCDDEALRIRVHESLVAEFHFDR